jgi:hypothetical protein
VRGPARDSDTVTDTAPTLFEFELTSRRLPAKTRRQVRRNVLDFWKF